MSDQPTEPTADRLLVEATATEITRVFGEFLNRAGFGNERIVIVRNGKQVAALIGIPDLTRLRSLDAA